MNFGSGSGNPDAIFKKTGPDPDLQLYLQDGEYGFHATYPALYAGRPILHYHIKVLNVEKQGQNVHRSEAIEK